MALLQERKKDWGQDITGLLQKKLIYCYPIKVGFFGRLFLCNFKKKNLILSHFGLILAMAELWHIHYTLNRKVTALYTSRWSVVLSSFSVLI